MLPASGLPLFAIYFCHRHYSGPPKMQPRDSSPITGLLLRCGAGEEECLNELVPLVRWELRRIAHHLTRKERQGRTLQTAALINEEALPAHPNTIDPDLNMAGVCQKHELTLGKSAHAG